MNRLESPIYLDYNATTPVDPAVIESMMPFFRESFGNPASITHSYGWSAKSAVEKARKQAADLIHCQDPSSIIWTSGATESNNLALQGVFLSSIAKRDQCHLITTQTEHKAVLDVAHYLETSGVEVTYLKPDSYGRISADDVLAALRPHTRLVSIIHANNEIGTINPIREIGANLRKRNILFHVDAAQSAGKVAIDVESMNVDLLSVSAHKIYGPKGVGFLFARGEILKSGSISPIFFGGSQEKRLRPGTLNVPGIVGLGKACELCLMGGTDEISRMTQMRDLFIANVLEKVPSARLNGHPQERVYSNISLSFQGLPADVLTLGLSRLAISAGSACAGGEPSHVLAAIGLSQELARATVRIGIGRFTTPQDLEIALEQIESMVSAASNALRNSLRGPLRNDG